MKPENRNNKELLYLLKDVALANLKEEERQEIFHLVLLGKKGADDLTKLIKQYLLAKMKRHA